MMILRKSVDWMAQILMTLRAWKRRNEWSEGTGGRPVTNPLMIKLVFPSKIGNSKLVGIVSRENLPFFGQRFVLL